MAVTWSVTRGVGSLVLLRSGRSLEVGRVIGAWLTCLARQRDSNVAGESSEAGTHGQLINLAWVEPVD